MSEEKPDEETSLPAELGRTFVWFTAIAAIFVIVGAILWMALK